MHWDRDTARHDLRLSFFNHFLFTQAAFVKNRPARDF